MLWAQPIYKPMSTLLQDYERLLAIIKNPHNCEWHTPTIINTINAFRNKHKADNTADVVDEMHQHLLLQTKKA
jgi:hypothetical protein